MSQEEKLQMMKETLKETIAMRTYVKDKFQVFAWEAGVGKSRYTNEAIVELLTESILNNEIKTSYLIVKKFVSDVIETEETLREGLNLLGDNYILGITSENYKEYVKAPKKIEDALIVVITHERYLKLCNEGFGKAFKKTVLIIDEKISLPVYSFSKQMYDSLRPLLKFSIQKEFDNLNEELLSCLEKLDAEGKNTLKVIEVTKDYISQLENFKKRLSDEGEKTYNKFEDYLGNLPLFFNSKIIYNNSIFYTLNKDLNLVMFENNILLDASACIDETYSTQLFKFANSSKIVDYKKTILAADVRNSGKAKMKMNAKVEMLDLIRASKNIEKKRA